MWLVTTFGFFSVVEKPWDRETGTLTIRARARDDLEALKATYLPGLSEIREDPTADYRFRAQGQREQVAAAFAQAIRDIDYDNFKSAVGERQGHRRAAIYHSVWGALYRIQTDRP